MFRKTPLLLLLFILSLIGTLAQEKYPDQVENDYIIKNYEFESGEQLAELKQHYVTIGTPQKDNYGHIKNAVLIMHGTTGSAQSLLNERFAGHLFGTGQLLDASRYFIVLTDGIGHGKSSRPSEGLHMKFPKYTYNDMVKAQYLLLTEHLGISHLRLVLGTSMGAMHTWVWGYTYPDFMDTLMPLASLPVEIAGRNRMLRKMGIDLIEMDPEWKNGEYSKEPQSGLMGATAVLFFMGSSPLQLQLTAPTRQQAEAILDKTKARMLAALDANDVIYALDASRNYNPAPHLSKIRAPLFAVNSADDEVNPPELGIMEQEIKKVKRGRYILLPTTDKTSGHGTHSNPAIWGSYLKELLEISGKQE